MGSRNRVSITDHDVVQLGLENNYGTVRYGLGAVPRVVHSMRRADEEGRCRLVGWVRLEGRRIVVVNYGSMWEVHRYLDPADFFD